MLDVYINVYDNGTMDKSIDWLYMF